MNLYLSERYSKFWFYRKWRNTKTKAWDSVWVCAKVLLIIPRGGGGGAMKVCAAPKAGVSLSIGDRRILRLRRIILRLNFDEVQYGYFLFRQIRRGYIIFK